MMKLSHIPLIFVCVTAAFAVAALADTPVYKWTDAQGVVHYSDKAPVKAPQAVTVITLPELPPVTPETEARERAYIAGINHWYQQVLNRQSQLRQEQLQAWRASRPAPPVERAVTAEVASASPLCWDCGRLWLRRRYRRPLLSPLPPTRSPVFKSNIWSTQPNPFTQQLYHP